MASFERSIDDHWTSRTKESEDGIVRDGFPPHRWILTTAPVAHLMSSESVAIGGRSREGKEDGVSLSVYSPWLALPRGRKMTRETGGSFGVRRSSFLRRSPRRAHDRVDTLYALVPRLKSIKAGRHRVLLRERALLLDSRRRESGCHDPGVVEEFGFCSLCQIYKGDLWFQF